MSKRVVSLVPSATETLLAWDVDVVACTRFCEQPSLRHVGGTKNPDVAAIVELRPDVVVMDREENRREDADALLARGVPVHATDVVGVTDLDEQLAGLANACGCAPHPLELVPPAPARATAFVAIWRRPWMTISAGTYGSSLLAHLGIANAFADVTVRYPEVDLAEVAARRPDVVLLPSEPYPFAERHLGELRGALGDVDVQFVDGRDLFWWGVRTPGAVSRLGAALSPFER